MSEFITTSEAGTAAAGVLLDSADLASAPVHAPALRQDPLTGTISRSGTALLDRQYHDGFWRFDLEADTAIPSEYILLQHFMGTVDAR